MHSPEWYLDGDVAVDGDGKQAEDGVLGEDQDEACYEQAAVEVGAESRADDDGERDGQDSHSDVGHSQRHHEEVGDALQVAVEANSPADQHVPQDGEHGDQQLQDDVEDALAAEHGDTGGEVADEEGGNRSTSIAAACRPPHLLTSTAYRSIQKKKEKKISSQGKFTTGQLKN